MPALYHRISSHVNVLHQEPTYLTDHYYQNVRETTPNCRLYLLVYARQILMRMGARTLPGKSTKQHDTSRQSKEGHQSALDLLCY